MRVASWMRLPSTRTGFLRLLTAASSCLVGREAAHAAAFIRMNRPRREISILPLKRCGGAYCIEYLVEGQRFRAVADTGSPFLLVAGPNGSGECARWGCLFTPGASIDIGDASLEGFGGQDVGVEWRRGTLNLGDFEFTPVNFGVVRSSVGFGGTQAIYFGLVRDRQPRVRPTLLEQTDVRSLQFDFPRERMILSRHPLLTRREGIPLVDLRRLGAPVAQYACIVNKLIVNDELVELSRPCVAVIDTGTTGLVISDSLYDSDELPLSGAAIRTATVVVDTEKGHSVAFHASSRRRNGGDFMDSIDFPFIVTPVSLPWFRLGAPDALGTVVGDGPLIAPGSGSPVYNPMSTTLDGSSGVTDRRAHDSSFIASCSTTASHGDTILQAPPCCDARANAHSPDTDRREVRRARLRYAKLAERGQEGEAAEPHVLFLGLAFLSRLQLTIDIDEMRMHVIESTAAK